MKKYFAYYNRKYDNELSIEILDKNRTKKVVDFYKKFPIEGYLAGFVLKGEKDILDIAYSCGIGNKNSQGFGCIEKIDEINKFDNYIKVL
ncbi:CRISPR-associated endoribonuclease Cas6 [Caloramator sp. Dgby_cultured_2]|uniref:CRISPR-associated endoribonuclease Cas6 n=1 Tax=Caloramator sp. Dgby_cultured_2 TaxID=3029174 RepID=UPI0031599193